MTREEAIERIKIHMLIHRMAEDRALYITEALNMAIEALEADVPETNVGKWIPCDKGKPDPYRRVLMTERRPDWDGKEYCIVTLDSFCNHRGDVVAWMPSPKPFTDDPEWETGEWIDDGDPLTFKCSKCGYVVKRYNNTNFCPNCGVKMK